MKIRRRKDLEEFLGGFAPEGARVYSADEVRVILSQDEVVTSSGLAVPLWHISVSCAARYPTWDEIKAVWQQLKPDLTMGMFFPGKGMPYINAQKNTFHLWEIVDQIALATVRSG